MQQGVAIEAAHIECVGSGTEQEQYMIRKAACLHSFKHLPELP